MGPTTSFLPSKIKRQTDKKTKRQKDNKTKRQKDKKAKRQKDKKTKRLRGGMHAAETPDLSTNHLISALKDEKTKRQKDNKTKKKKRQKDCAEECMQQRHPIFQPTTSFLPS